MSKLSALIPMKSKITVYVPATVEINKEIDNSEYIERVARLLSDCFGGATASPVSGYWVTTGGDLVAEKYVDDVVSLCMELKREMQQEAIALEYNGAMYFI